MHRLRLLRRRRPYQARYISHRSEFAYIGQEMASEHARFAERKMSVATKCTFCMDRVAAAKEKWLTPGSEPEVTPACVNSCIAGVLAFGDKEDPNSNVSKLLDEMQYFR